MKIRSLFLLIIFFITIHKSFCQIKEDIEYHIVKKPYSKEHNGFELAKNKFLTSKFSKDFFFIYLVFKDLSGQTIVTKTLTKHDADISLADETYLFYENKGFEDTIFLWKMDGEYYSKIYFYSFIKEKMKYLGEVTIGDNCAKDGCEAFNVQAENISVQKTRDFISIKFIGNHIFFSEKISPSGSLSAENLIINYKSDPK